MLSKYNKKKLSPSEIKTHISEGSSKLIKYAFKIKEDHEEFEKFKNEFLQEYKKNLTIDSNLFDGIEEVLAYLDKNNIFFGIVTNKYYEYTDPIIKSFPQLRNLKIVVCPDDVSVSKPDPEGIFLACKKLGVSPKQTVFLGDHQTDLSRHFSRRKCYWMFIWILSLRIDKEIYDCKFVNTAKSSQRLVHEYKKLL